ncbi:catechol O-methyltransferase-like [Patiria miniata]|uniref:catechol O-methyltransferase n=1 Tax=Patiria miniata TaxID=46514 RepID=A0A914AWX5_PATMI|nr:catechol O-methyltransferase-like [Patiria miniata]XP_038068199.1 catechol O-methyltransferase-like [Patiria miniata]
MSELSWWSLAKVFVPKVVPRLWLNIWHWNTVEERLLEFVKSTAKEGDVTSVLSSADRFIREKEWMMNIQCEKRLKIEEVLEERKPKACLELGTYFGYSAISTASKLPKEGRLITLEIKEKNAAIAQQFIQFAGLNDKISISVGKATDIIPTLRSRYSIDKLDYVFLDHWKSDYLPDLKLLEEHGLLSNGAVIIADNILIPGIPDYLKYVESSDKFTTERFYFQVESLGVKDAMTISIYNGNQ